MLKRFKRLMSNQKQRTGIIICAISVFIVAVGVFISFELKHNQSLYIENYKEEQQLMTDQVAIRFQSYIQEQQLTISEAIDKIISEVKTSGSRFWFIAQNNELIFQKNNMTSGLSSHITLSSFVSEYEADGMQITSSSITIGDIQYTIGICTTMDYIVSAGQLFKHNVYIIMPLILISSFLLVLFIFGILQINRQENKINQLNMEAINRNITIEQLTNKVKKIRLNDIGGVKKQDDDIKEKPVYNKDVLGSLLAKINRDNIIPLTIVIIELTTKNKIYTSKDYQNFIKSASKYIDKEHVLAEIIPGVFTILMFHTLAENKDEIKRTLIGEWALPLKEKGIKVRMGITCIEDYDANVENVFEIVYREVSGMHS